MFNFFFFALPFHRLKDHFFFSPKTEAFEYALLMGAKGKNKHFFNANLTDGLIFYHTCMQMYGKTGNKNVKQVLQHGCKMT